eukprot:CAMPEP_0183344450 /NCGR_PEP_ID=MMETSP0164_2-20130417/10127_1 /TAXON_ID=221442 /ORGANISM="Coccolithus pelagicus ssp braarudi, Strain PLY182g" /LENGTH=89 /DNA_ID=CAMNT_0025515447 /DNA_START=763 /DNA_END=1032 /DNA_ORIENTATION=+
MASMCEANGSEKRMGAAVNLPDCTKYEKQTSSGPKVEVMSTSPSALYLRPGPPVYTNAEAAPALMSDSSCSGAAEERRASGTAATAESA